MSASPQFLPPPYNYLTVFISHATEDRSTVDYYAALLNPHFRVWQYEKERQLLPGADPLNRGPEQVAEGIRECDYFILLVSDQSMSPGKTWCARELDLALHLQRERATRPGVSAAYLRPIVVPIFCKEMSWRKTGGPRPTTFPVHDFLTGEKKPAFSFKMWHDPHGAHPARTDNELVEFMKPQLLRVRRDILADDEFDQTRVFELCGALFEEDDLAPPEVIKDWTLRLEDGVRRVVPLPVKRTFFSRTSNIDFHFELDSLFYIVRLYNAPIAFAYLSYHRGSRIVIANYIGVGNGWRSGGVAERFISAIEADVRCDYPAARGLLFSIEPVDFGLISEFLDEAEKSGRQPVSDQHPAYEQIRRFRRLEFYRGRLRASVYMDVVTRRPLIYTELCLDIEAAPDEWGKAENDYWLLWRPAAHGGPPPSWEEVVNVTCIEVNARSIVYRHPDRTGAAYWRYANDLAKINVQRAQDREVVPDTLSVGRMYRRLVKIVENYREIAI